MKQTWLQDKERLVEAGLLPAFFFDIERSLQSFRRNSELRDRLPVGNAESDNAAYTWDPLNIENNIRALAELAERCFGYRREIRELEILAVKVAMDYEQFKRLAKVDRALDIQRLSVNVKQEAQKTHVTAASTFGDKGDIQRGFGSLSIGRGNELVVELTDASEQTDLIERRWAALHDYQDAYFARHSEPGNAHNYEERATRLMRLFAEDLGAIVKSGV